MDNRFKLLYLVIFLLLINFSGNVAFAKELRRDPFVPLVDNQGNIISGQNLLVPVEEVLAKIILKGILWDTKNPLAVINGKVLAEGSQIVFVDGGFSNIITIKKINPESVILNYNERDFELRLRKKEKE